MTGSAAGSQLQNGRFGQHTPVRLASARDMPRAAMLDDSRRATSRIVGSAYFQPPDCTLFQKCVIKKMFHKALTPNSGVDKRIYMSSFD